MRVGEVYMTALYGTDVIPGEKGKTFNKERGDKVIMYARNFLDEVFTLNKGSWKDINKIKVKIKI